MDKFVRGRQLRHENSQKQVPAREIACGHDHIGRIALGILEFTALRRMSLLDVS